MSNYHAFHRSRLLYLRWAPALIAFFSYHYTLIYFFFFQFFSLQLTCYFLLRVVEPGRPRSIGWALKRRSNWAETEEWFWLMCGNLVEEMKRDCVEGLLHNSEHGVYGCVWGWRLCQWMMKDVFDSLHSSKYGFISLKMSVPAQISTCWYWIFSSKWLVVFTSAVLLISCWVIAQLYNMKCHQATARSGIDWKGWGGGIFLLKVII